MLSLGSLAFLNPWALAGLAALPLLWWLLRAIPPSPRRLAFPGVRLLLGLEDPERTPDRTPWWLILLRCLIAALVIGAFALPVLNPRDRLAGDGTVLILMDGGWSSAPDWEARRAFALDVVDQAARDGRPVAFHVLADPVGEDFSLTPRAAPEWRGEIEALEPAPHTPDRTGFTDWLKGAEPPFDAAIWLNDGLGEAAGDLADALVDAGPLRLVGPERLARGLTPPRLTPEGLIATVLRADTQEAETLNVAAWTAKTESGVRRLGVAQASFAAGEGQAEAVFDMPLELRNKIGRIALTNDASAGGTVLADDSVRRKRFALVTGETGRSDQPLLSQLHYLRRAIDQSAEMVETDLDNALDTSPDAVVLADVATLTAAERDRLSEWVTAGGLLIRFAGPRLARLSAESATAGLAEDDLLPVTLRRGGRAFGGALAWDEPQQIRPFPPQSPFAGLAPPDDVYVSRQVLAQPGPGLADKVWAALSDGTPLVTADALGGGQVALFHISANAEWSTLPLSGLFVEMMERLAGISGGGSGNGAAGLEGLVWTPEKVLNGFGEIVDPDGALRGSEGERLASEPVGPDAPPGVYASGDKRVAINTLREGEVLTPAPSPPSGAAVTPLGLQNEISLTPWLLAAAIAFLMLDGIAALAISGRLRFAAAASAGAVLFFAALHPAPASASDEDALYASLNTVLAYVRTGDAELDRMSEGGLRGLSRILFDRTAIEPVDPRGVDLEVDEIGFYPLLYWPVSDDQPTPSDEAYAKLNAFMRSGGAIVFDTRDQHLSAAGTEPPGRRALRRLAAGLDLPPLEPVPPDHVLTRTFYLLNDFPGRWAGGTVWVEATPTETAEQVEGAPFRRLNDGVSPVIVGSADWAAAWAVNEDGSFLAPVGRGFRQREMAFRFGVNLVMYIFTGSYKSDQVHVPALLDRLGQ